MTALQIIALVIIGLGVLTAIGFFVAFIVELRKSETPAVENTEEEAPETVEEVNNEINEIDIDDMLAKLEENSKKKIEEDQAEEAATEVVEEKVEEVQAEEAATEVVEEVQAEEVAEVKEEVTQNEEKVEEEPKTTVIIKKIVKEGPEFDYRVRLEKIKESEEKLEKDLEKTEKAITKYERTERRLARNQKLLDRKAGELANLNLLMYNITDIKNIDEEKKARQEELVAHISELKASIEDAEKYLAANAEKHANNIKLRDYLKSEQVRYKEEWAELEILIAQSEGKEPTTTVETTIETKTDDDNGENE